MPLHCYKAELGHRDIRAYLQALNEQLGAFNVVSTAEFHFATAAGLHARKEACTASLSTA
jgi:hypothetical protein